MPMKPRPRPLRLLAKPVWWVGTPETRCGTDIDLPAILETPHGSLDVFPSPSLHSRTLLPHTAPHCRILAGSLRRAGAYQLAIRQGGQNRPNPPHSYSTSGGASRKSNEGVTYLISPKCYPSIRPYAWSFCPQSGSDPVRPLSATIARIDAEGSYAGPDRTVPGRGLRLPDPHHVRDRGRGAPRVARGVRAADRRAAQGRSTA